MADLTAADAARLLADADPANERLHDDGPRQRLADAAPDLARAVIRLEARVERLRAACDSALCVLVEGPDVMEPGEATREAKRILGAAVKVSP